MYFAICWCSASYTDTTTLVLHKYQFAVFASSTVLCNASFCFTVLLLHVLHTVITQSSTIHIQAALTQICRDSLLLSVSSCLIFSLASEIKLFIFVWFNLSFSCSCSNFSCASFSFKRFSSACSAALERCILLSDNFRL